MKIRALQISPKRALLHKRIKLIHGFDVVRFYLDIAGVPVEVRHALDERDHIRPASVPYHPHLLTEIELHQPSIEKLMRLEELLRGRAQVVVWYAEPAADCVPSTPFNTSPARDFLLSSMHPCFCKTVAKIEGGTVYFKPRTNAQGVKNEGVDALYSDRRSKLAASVDLPRRRAVHLEHRLNGKADLEGAGIITLRDLIEFDHRAFWCEHLILVRPVTATSIGKWLLGSEAEKMSPKAVSERGRKWMEAHSLKGVFCLHNAWISPGGADFFGALPRFDGLEDLYTHFERQARRKAQRALANLRAS